MANVSLMLRLPLAVTLVATSLVPLTTGAVAQVAPPNLPAAILCYVETDQSWRVGYLSRVNKSGEALYVSADRRLSVSVAANGVVAAPTNRPASSDCYGKTLDELRSSGRIMEFQRTK
jgi:hypothetical protein